MSIRTLELTSEIFEDAVEHINKHGWTQGMSLDFATGRVCAMGAISLHQKDDTGEVWISPGERRAQLVSAQLATAMVLMGLDPDRDWTIVDWNDKPGRTEAEVIDALTLAAKTLRDQGR